MIIQISFLSIRYYLTIGLTILSVVLGCGLLPQGAVTSVAYTVRGFTLSPQMVYSESNIAKALIPTISGNEQTAKQFMENLVMNAVNDVLQEQGRNALLPDATILLILQQLNITINYMPLNCKTASSDPANPDNNGRIVMPDGCFILGDMVTSICKDPACTHMPLNMVEPVPSNFMTFTGSLRTSNVIMASWSRQMWQNILNKVHQRLTAGPFRRYFNSATVTVNN